ncbi:MAG: amino acid ABC transporter [Rhodobacteraceae bacterium]|jgi:polar amino acid transport system substrate-binding protein|uniref:Amino acid ABC transporter substrate-binding protein, PAAT family n=1 Tax=Salipiger profundus TaxID=1229727 RepID=A0A1U7D0H5_9RHOB|nr:MULTISPECIES: transporter substrate-binding domain-containing protein [Salipiger]APX21585.1 amino acid ABC transporter substrate-binding protein, PAAT family [Salipiger profundus]MAB08983.1 amino acid ABC transporter [Paracoccaceae bacterium]GGA01340.1 amino acid ABC transporter [Salipiger profundus]SFC14624.1 amino acid ABC transporter substrate-binding protein, PAAT family [Salipiger profundus]
MKKILLGAAVMAMGAGAALAQDVVRLGTEGAYPPYNYIDDSGEVAGFERVLGDELCKRAELTCEWVTNDWDSIIPNLVSGNYDAIIAGMSITPEREEVVAFTQNYTPPSPSAFASMMDDIDLETAVIAAQTGTIQAAHVATMEGATLVEYPTPDETVAAMRSGEADAVLSDKDYLIPVVEESSDVSFVGDDVPLGGGIGMAFRQSDPELRETFDAAIQSMKDDGTLNELIVEYLGADSPKF